jgi:hypothetical protein
MRKYNLTGLYRELLKGGAKVVPHPEAQSFYQWLRNRGGKLSWQNTNHGMIIRLVTPISAPERAYTKAEVLALVKENERLKALLQNNPLQPNTAEL